MPLEEENVCCGKRRCVTLFRMYENICSDRDVLVLALRASLDIRAEEPDYSSNCLQSVLSVEVWKIGERKPGSGATLPLMGFTWGLHGVWAFLVFSEHTIRFYYL